ncbi:MAG: hypothetical protein HGA66_07120 [Holophaga sp.]|nr:hypothetical protein [Holophaga sp.]
MNDPSDPGQPADPAAPKKFDLNEAHRWTRTEMRIEPFGRVLVGPMSMNAMKPVTLAMEQKPSLSDTEMVRAIFQAVVEVPDAEDSWEGRKLTKEEAGQVEDAQLEAFATAGLGRKDWFVKEKGAGEECEYVGPAIPELVRRLQASFERINKGARAIAGSISPIFSNATRALLEQTERLASLSRLQSPLLDGFRSPFQELEEKLERIRAGMQSPGARAAESFQRELDQIDQQNRRLADLVSPSLGATEILRQQTEMARLTGLTGAESRQLDGLRADPLPDSRLQSLLEGPRVTPLSEHFKTISRENQELRDGIATLSSQTEQIRELFTSAINDNARYQTDEASATKRNFWIAIATVIISIASTCGTLTNSVGSGRESKRQQDEMIQALQQQNAHLAELVAGQRLTEARSAEERSKTKRTMHPSPTQRRGQDAGRTSNRAISQ